ncbi:alpha/beta hydrolase fold domain-containing protein [Microbacterium sp. MAHUQ-60]|uniref:alpha/beta hydrolase fold domain-containing protein n=1 Tax=unclassified Microbacterium TaxID=2609290 RepID=UPI00361DCF9E
MSTRMAMFRGYLRWRYRHRHDLGRMQRELPIRQRPTEMPPEVALMCEVGVDEIAGRTVHTLAPRQGGTGVQVVHLHGGAYVYTAQQAHWRALAHLVSASGATMHVPLYPLAPDATVDDAHPLVDAVLSRVRMAAGGGAVLLSGDSAGGGLALSHALWMRENGRRPVDGILLFSPWLDVTLTNPGIARLERRDPMLSRPMLVQAGRWWAGGRDTRDPLVSPLHGDLTGLPPVTTYIGGRDILLPDAQELDRRIRAVGGTSRLREWASGFHVFMAALTTKEARAAIADAAALLSLQVGADQAPASGIG